jgi:RNA polymerase sigma-70 factor (ECF subfamily)
VDCGKLEITRLLREWRAGNEAALDRLAPLLDGELRRLARGYMRRERPGATLQTTALVNEAYLKLVDYRDADWVDRSHFFAVSAKIMRRILVNRAEARAALKRGGRAVRVDLDEIPDVSSKRDRELIAVNDALNALAEIDARKARVVELRFFGGLSVEETAEVLKISWQTVARDWRTARAWLMKELGAS